MLFGGGGDMVGRGTEAEVGALGALSAWSCKPAFEPCKLIRGDFLPGGVS